VTWVVVKRPGRKPAFAPVGSYAAKVLLDRPVGYWPLADQGSTARDYSGGGQDGLYSGDVTLGLRGALGPLDRFASFNEPSAGTVALHIAGLVERPHHVTSVELWLRPHALATAELPFGFKFYGLYEQGAAIGFNTGNSGDLYGAVVPHLENRWHYIVAEFCNGSVRCGRLFVDGKPLRLRQVRGRPVPQHVSGDANVSGWSAGPGTTYWGGIEQVAVYNRGLTANQVGAHYAAARVGAH